MIVYNTSLNNTATEILQNQSKRNLAFFKRIAYLVIDARDQFCFSRIPNIGLTLGSYGYKKIGRTQSKQAFRELKTLGLFILSQPSRRKAYHIRLTSLGAYLYSMMRNRVEQPRNENHINNFVDKSITILKTDPLDYPKPTLSEIKTDPLKSRSEIKRDQDSLREILPRTTSCISFAQPEICFNDNIMKTLDSLTQDMRESLLSKFKIASVKTEIQDKDKYMETIIRKYVSDEAEIRRLQLLDRARGRQSEEDTRFHIQKMDSIPTYDDAKKADLLKAFRSKCQEMNITRF